MSAKYLTPEQLCALLGIKRTKLYDLVEQGLPYRALSPGGRTKVFVPAEVEAWLDARKRAKAPTAAAAPADAGPGPPRRGRPSKGKVVAPGERKWMKGYRKG
jgi:excisionase family DNA binding protein